MTEKEVVETLLVQAKIEPAFTELVWQKLEEENREFFQAYYLKLMVKQQIMEFNKLLEQQVQIMHWIHPSRLSPIPNSNGPHLPHSKLSLIVPHSSSGYAPENEGKALVQENVHHPMGSYLPNVFSNSSSSLYELPTHASRIDAPSAMLSTHSAMQRINGEMVKSEAGCSGSCAYMFGAESSVREAYPTPTIGDTAFNSVEPSTQPLNEPLLDADISSLGTLRHLSCNFSLSDLAADLFQSSDILESNKRSPFLATDDESFLDSVEREHQGEQKRLDGVSEGYRNE
ncbi:hypothetical protein V6N12_024591 [Hibiscus sabdariffa]|uniref:Uncharacterized protein n=1 Tax=Hibiscus sabdariffa TaxID=183260 RepID=A0ABR2G110_9ROSI